MSVLLPATVGLLVISALASYVNIIKDVKDYYDFGEKQTHSGDIIHVSLEDFASVKGVRHTLCTYYREECRMFIKCSSNCENYLTPISRLEKATFAVREEDRSEQNTNVCVAMYAFCIPAPYRVLNTTFGLVSPYQY